MFILVQTIKTVTIRPEIHLTQTRTIIIYHDSYLKQAPPGTSFGCTTSKHRLMENQNLWRRLTLNGLSSLMEWHNRFLLFHKQLCSHIDHHHILIKYWRLFVIPIILYVQLSKNTRPTTKLSRCWSFRPTWWRQWCYRIQQAWILYIINQFLFIDCPQDPGIY